MVVKCPQCKHYVSDTTSVCLHCGAVLDGEKPWYEVYTPGEYINGTGGSRV